MIRDDAFDLNRNLKCITEHVVRLCCESKIGHNVRIGYTHQHVISIPKYPYILVANEFHRNKNDYPYLVSQNCLLVFESMSANKYAHLRKIKDITIF